jgi:hypothetical protein
VAEEFRSFSEPGQKISAEPTTSTASNESETHRTPNIRTEFPMLKVGNAKCSDPGGTLAN